ncbi:hypothetical protein [Caulobacter sp. 1776]|uniref:hypothetical protein n=1 Tax=Caulobacter sp. 1776 TaxID=3156420 RepID=UPI0033963172
MNRRGGAGPLVASGLMALAAVIAIVWALGLTPSFGTATVGAAPTRGGGPWIERLGLSQLEPWSSPTPAFAERLAAYGDTPQGAALRRDLCQGAGMDGDPAFREARRALVRNDAGLCAGPIEHVTAVSPVIVAFGPRLGWPGLMAVSIVALGLGLWRLLVLKRAHDRWRFLDRSTFGAARRAGSG